MDLKSRCTEFRNKGKLRNEIKTCSFEREKIGLRDRILLNPRIRQNNLSVDLCNKNQNFC